MDFFKKLDELHAKEVTPKEFKKVCGESQEEVLQKVMDFVDKFDAKQAELEMAEKGKVAIIRPAAEPLAPAAVVLEPAAAKPKIGKKLVASPAKRAAAAVKAAKAVNPLKVKVLGGTKHPTLADVIQVRLEGKEGVLIVPTGKGAKGLPGKVAASKTGRYKFVKPVKGIEGLGIKGIKIIERGDGLVKGKGKGLLPKVAKGPKGPKGGFGGGGPK